MTARERARALFPPTGAAYELFDVSVLLLILGVIDYIVTGPPAPTRDSLAAPLTFLPLIVWGTFLAVAGLGGIVCSYRPAWVRGGYALVVSSTAFWSACFAVGVIFLGGPVRGLASAFLWGWIARGAMKERDRGLGPRVCDP